MKRILQFPKKPVLRLEMEQEFERDSGDEYFDLIRGWIQNSDTPRFFLKDLWNKGKIMKNSATWRNLLVARQLDARLRNLATPGIQSPMAHELVLQAEVKFKK